MYDELMMRLVPCVPRRRPSSAGIGSGSDPGQDWMDSPAVSFIEALSEIRTWLISEHLKCKMQ